jgi:hypothetical protein
MADNSQKSIEEINAGEYVINEKGEPARVSELVRSAVGSRQMYLINGRLEATPDHPFMTKEGWKAVDPGLLAQAQASTDLYQQIEAGQLEEGDYILTQEGQEKVRTIQPVDRLPEEPVYTLILEDGDSFYANGFLVADGK